MWDLFQNDEPTTNVLMHIIIFGSIQKNIFVFVSVALNFTYYFSIRATIKLLEKKGCYILFWYPSISSIELRY